MVVAPRMERAPGERDHRDARLPPEWIRRLGRNRRSRGHVTARGVATPVCFALWGLEGAEHVGWAVAPLSSTLSFSSVSPPSLVGSSIFALALPQWDSRFSGSPAGLPALPPRRSPWHQCRPSWFSCLLGNMNLRQCPLKVFPVTHLLIQICQIA